MIKLCLSDTVNGDVKLRAIVYALDRLLGRPVENVNLEVNGQAEEMADLSKDEISVLQRIVGRSQNSREIVAGHPPEALDLLTPSPLSAPALEGLNTPSGETTPPSA